MFVKSLSVGDGDMFYICHGSDNFSIIDSCLNDENRDEIINEIRACCKNKNVRRFISTHPDQDHFNGIKYLFDNIHIPNFYCVKNNCIKKDETDDFKYYCRLRDGDNHFYIQKGCTRKWMNLCDDERGSSGINILWPNVNNERFLEELDKANSGESFNNISPVIEYSIKDGPNFLWFGDIEYDFLLDIYKEIEFPQATVIFAPHHGRETGRIPDAVLKQINPSLIVVGEAPSKYLNYYGDYNTITQNSAGNIIFNVTEMLDIYVDYKNNLSTNVIKNSNALQAFRNCKYLGSIEY